MAVKIIDITSHTATYGVKSLAREEADLLGSLSMFFIYFAFICSGHPNIVKFTDVYEDRHFLYVIMELCTGGEIFDKLIKMKRFTELDMKTLCDQIFSALEYIHSLNIIHRDVKAENFLFSSDGSIKLIDFGLATRLKHDNESLKEIVGSAHYIAPEMLDRKYSKPVDIWSAGVLVFLMIHGRYPFDGETDGQILSRVKVGAIVWECPEFKPSPPVTMFIQKLLQRDPARRISAVDALQDPFLSNQTSTKEQGESILISEDIVNKINTSIVVPTKTKKQILLSSETENALTDRILDLTRQFELGTHRGWKKTGGTSTMVSAPTSPKSMFYRQGTKALTSGLNASTKTTYITSPNPPRDKRAKSLPGSFRVHFDENPPDIYIYGENSSELRKFVPISPPGAKRIVRKGTTALI